MHPRPAPARLAILRRPPCFEAALRALAVPVVWAGLSVPRAPHWAVAEHAGFHVAAAAAFVWAVFVLVAVLRGPKWSARLSRIALAVDMVGVGVLAWFTGGWVSPLLALVLIELLALVLGSDPRRTLGAALAAATALGIGVAVTATGLLRVPDAFAAGGGTPLPLVDNPVYLATLGVLGAATVLLNLATLVFLVGRAGRGDARLARALTDLAAADRALDGSFRKIEELATTSTRLAEVARATTGIDAAQPGSQYRH
jgi:hypothetical protein